MSSALQAQALAVDIGTGGYETAVRSTAGEEAIASIDQSDETKWQGANAFDIGALPERLTRTVQELAEAGWNFQPPVAGAAVSFSVRQHDMVLTRADGSLLADGVALGWQCNAAVEEVRELQQAGAEQAVGKIEPRFILPKLRWLLKTKPSIKDELAYVMTTGDYIAWMLTGRRTLSTSDAVSNGLLLQSTKQLAADVLRDAGFDVQWFPEVIQSGTVVGTVTSALPEDDGWNALREHLQGWDVVASLGDNHATAVGCGLSDAETIIISAGNSGTINRMCPPGVPLRGNAACFEYYHNRMLLMMLADCAVWYDRFVKKHGQGQSYADLNQAALDADIRRIERVRQRPVDGGWGEEFPDDWAALSLGEQTASTQFSIALELMLLVQLMLQEVEGAESAVKRFVLTGGLAQSPFFQHVLAAGLGLLVESPAVNVSDRQGPLAYQTGAYGALINARLPAHAGDLAATMADLCPLKPCAQPTDDRLRQLTEQLAKHGLGRRAE